MSEITAPRVVPGAPPPAPLSKTQKKRRKTKAKGPETTADSSVVAPDTISAAVSERGVDVNDAHEPAQEPEPNTQPESDAAPAPEEDSILKLSPIVDLIHKRLKVTTKKINRIAIYAATEPDKLNDDQKRTLKTLPTLEGIQKELGEVKRAVEAHEADLAQGLAVKRAEAEKAEKERIANAVAAAERSVSGKVYDILNFVRVRVAATSGEIPTTSLESVEGAVVLRVADMLLGMDQNLKQNAVQGIVKGNGNVEGVAYATLIETVQELLQASGVPVPAPVNETNGVIVSVPVPPPTGSFHFMQASELDAQTHEANTEWVAQPEQPEIQAPAEPATNGHEDQGVAAHNDQIDWSEDHGGLPSVASLHAKFGTSGEVTPVEESQPQETDPSAPSVDPKKGLKEDEDGFTQYRSGRGRGRGHPRGGRGYHRGGGERGGFRGGDRNHRGGYRGGERGGYRGRGEWRGDGEHRGSGEWRGDGEHRSRGEWRGDGEHRSRGEWRGDGEHRGRGRGRGRGGDRGGHRGGGDKVLPTPAPAPAPPAAAA